MRLASLLVLTGLTVPHASAQWIKPQPADAPRTPDGKINLRGPAPRTADGKPDLSGMWFSTIKFNNNLAAEFKGEVPMTPWAKALYDERRGNKDVLNRTLRGLDNCLRAGLLTGVATSVCQTNIEELLTES